jgi:hypothetical protein
MREQKCGTLDFPLIVDSCAEPLCAGAGFNTGAKDESSHFGEGRKATAACALVR